MWASAQEAYDEFVATTFPDFHFEVRDVGDDGEFGTWATVYYYEKGVEVHSERFSASTEDPPMGGFSAYGNGLSNNAETQALSAAWAWHESMERHAEAARLSKVLGREVHPLEIAFSPFGPEWEREQAERYAPEFV